MTDPHQGTMEEARALVAGAYRPEEGAVPLEALMRFKHPFVLLDYGSHFEAGTRTQDRISVQRGWQVTACGAVAFLARGVPVTVALAILSLVWLMFLLMECADRAALKWITSTGVERERLLAASRPEDQWRSLSTWTFGNTAHRSRSRRQHIRECSRMLWTPRLAIWHYPLAIVIALLIVFGK